MWERSLIDQHSARAIRSAEAIATVAQIRRLQNRTRQLGLSFLCPLWIYGAAALVSAPLLAWAPLWAYQVWWLSVAVCAPVGIYLSYRRRARTLGVGIGPARAVVFVLVGEAVAALLWFLPLGPAGVNTPWLALVVVAAAAGWQWSTRALYWVAGGVLLLVLGLPVVDAHMAVADLCVGAWLSVTAFLWQFSLARESESRTFENSVSQGRPD